MCLQNDFSAFLHVTFSLYFLFWCCSYLCELCLLSFQVSVWPSFHSQHDPFLGLGHLISEYTSCSHSVIGQFALTTGSLRIDWLSLTHFSLNLFVSVLSVLKSTFLKSIVFVFLFFFLWNVKIYHFLSSTIKSKPAPLLTFFLWVKKLPVIHSRK